MKLKLNQDVKKAAEKEPEFPKVIYYLLSFSLVLFVILTALEIRVKYEDGENGPVFPGNHQVAKKILTSQKDSKGLRRRNLPTAILMGSRGTGLELLKEILEGHPSLKMVQENLRFFEDGNVFNNGLYWYRDEMPETHEGQLAVDVAPEIFVSPIAHRRISLLLPDVKFIVTVRDPIARILAEYTRRMLYSKLPASTRRIWRQEPSPHFDLSKEVILGRYSVFYRRWLQHYQERQFLFVSYEKLVKEPISEFKRIENFLGVQCDTNATDNALLTTREIAKEWQQTLHVVQEDNQVRRIIRMKNAFRLRYSQYVLDLIRLTGDSFYKKWL